MIARYALLALLLTARAAVAQDVASLLKTHCIDCHRGPSARGGLDLGSHAGLLKGGASGPAIVPGKSSQSRLIQRIRHDEKPGMPYKRDRLADAVIRQFAAWVDAGAPYTNAMVKEFADETWWSLRAITKPPVPDAADAETDHPIDRFILARLRDKKLHPNPQAARRDLLRRVTFDCIGLPPTPEELDAFLCDPAPDAYEQVVDRLLASPHFGERWARHWMDVVHFAETHGHDQDVPRDNAWPYRDYLIRAFNADKPYGRFIQEQIAGDILFPQDPTVIPALGFLSAGPWDESSLKDIREDSIDRKAGQYLDRDDMVTTVSLALLSTTVQCARCHDHKFDPIRIDEYYGLQAVFAGIDRADRAYDPDPVIGLRRLELKRRKEQLKDAAVVAQFARQPDVIARVAALETAVRTRANDWTVLDPIAFTAEQGSKLTLLPDRSILSGGDTPERDVYVIEANLPDAAFRVLRLEVLTDPSLPLNGPGRQGNGNLHLTEFRAEFVPADRPGERVPLQVKQARADFDQDGWGVARAIDGQRQTAWGIYPKVGIPHTAYFYLAEPLPRRGRLIVTLEQHHGGGHLIGRLRLSATAGLVDRDGVMSPRLQHLLRIPANRRGEAEVVELTRDVVHAMIDEDLASLPAMKLVYAAASDFAALGSFRPAKSPRPIHVLRRGDIRQPGNEALPAALGCVSGATFRVADVSAEGERRAALARWISDPANPLTWRSIVNRLWHHHFGRGLVATPNDFGRMGEMPSHPELLDWLAATLLEEGGSLKTLHRLMVTSAAYRQSSQHHAAFAKIDGENRFHWRMNPSRLDAESLRDAVLAVSGRLDRTMGGPSVRHFVQKPALHRTPTVDYAAFDPDTPGASRRSVYRFLFRTLPDPFMDALDCPDASQFTAARASSVTPLQALEMLNDPFMVRMSEHFARRLAEAGPVEMQIRLAHRLALGRDPTPREVESFRAYISRNGLANACRVLLNCNEFLFIP